MKKYLFVILIFSLSCFSVSGQTYNSSYGGEREGRKFLRDQISKWGECKNVAMTLTGGDVAIYQRSSFCEHLVWRCTRTT